MLATKTANRYLKIFIKFSWPILVNSLRWMELFPIINYQNHTIAVIQYNLIPVVTLLLAWQLHRFGKVPSFSILIAIGYVINGFGLINKSLIIFNFNSLWAYVYYFMVLLSIVLLVKMCSYLWYRCYYNKLFYLYEIIVSGPKFIAIINRIEQLLEFLQVIWRFKKLLAILMLSFIYSFWFKKYCFLLPNATTNQFINYIWLMLVPLGITMLATFLYKSGCLLNKAGLILGALISVAAGSYGIINYIKYYYKFIVSLSNKDLIIILQQLKQLLDNLNSWVWVIDGMVGAIGMYVIAKYGIGTSKNLKRSINYGSAKFLELTGIKQLIHPAGLPVGIIPNITDFNNLPKTINIIKNQKGGKLIKIKSHHTTLIAPSRAGKGIGIIIPILLDYPGPVFVTDIKGENYYVTARARKKLGREVYVFDPFNITTGVGVKINPLDFLTKSGSLVTNSLILADLMCPLNVNDSAEARHFQEQAVLVLQCLCLYVVCKPKIVNKTLAMVYDLLCSPQNITDLFAQIAESRQLGDGVVASLANRILGIHYRELSSILTTAYSCIKFVNVPEIRQATSSSSIALTDITKGELDLFICIPPKHLSTQQRLLRLITGIVFTNIQDAKGQVGKHNILMLLDEMRALGYMKQIEQILSFGAGFGINLLVVSQTIGFLKNIYPGTWDSFFSNQLSIFFGCNDPMTAEFIAKKIGKTTIETTSISENISTQKNIISSKSSKQTSNSLAETDRDVLMPDEIQRLGNNVVLVFNAGEKPILCRRINYWEQKAWIDTWDPNPFYENIKQQQRCTWLEYKEIVWRVLTT